MQGQSLRLITKGKQPLDWRKSMYYHYYEYPQGWHFVKRHYGIRTDRYKLIHFYNDINDWELFDLKLDPTEMENRFNDPAYQEIKSQLILQLDSIRVAVGESH